MTEHELKVIPPFFDGLASGKKTFEIRYNDRGFCEGDTLHLREWHQDGGYTGRELIATVTYMSDFKQQPGYVVMGICVREVGS